MADVLQCTGALPVALTLANWIVHVSGCTLTSHGTEMVLTIDALTRDYETWQCYQCGTHAQTRGFFGDALFSASKSGVTMYANKWPCVLTNLAHTVRARCAAAGPSWSDGGAAELRLLLAEGELRREVALPLAPLRLPRRPLGVQCSGTPIFGDATSHLWMLRATALRWQSLNFSAVLVFGRDAAACAAAERRVPGALCEVRGYFTPLHGRNATVHSPFFQQTVHLQLCLSYARAASAAFLALTDADELPPQTLWAQVLSRVLLEGRPGIHLFFDATRTCMPASACPCTTQDWATHCNAKAWQWKLNGPDGKAGRSNTKPIVVPALTEDVSIHGFVSVVGSRYSTSWHRTLAHHDGDVVGCPCLQHVTRGDLKRRRR